MTTKRGKDKDWLEMHFRRAGLPEPRCIPDLRCEDYELRGYKVRLEELDCYSNLLGMFRQIPAGMEDWFNRGMQALDFIVLCRQVGSRVRTYPMIVATREQLPDFADETTKVVKPSYYDENGERRVIVDLFVAAVELEWNSLCLN